jgi:hypothetical protein
MTRDELDAYVWSQLSVRKHAAGRRVVSRIVADAVRDWPSAAMERSDRGEVQAFGSIYAKSLARRQQQYGMGIILTLVLSALISEVVKTLIRWWLESRENRAAMQAMRETP